MESRQESFRRASRRPGSPRTHPPKTGILLADVLVPEVGVVGNERAHQFDASWMVKDGQSNPVLGKKGFCSEEILILTDDYLRNFEEQDCACAHDAGTECTYKSEAVPVATSPGVADADDLSVSGWIATLHPEVMAACDHAPFYVGQH